jgi:Transposase DDE domain
MTRMTYFHQSLKKDFFNRITFLRNFLSDANILTYAESENYHWRERIWTPIQTLWTFLIQVLNPDFSCRAAVAQVLAEQAAMGELTKVSADPTAYCQARRRIPIELFKMAFQKIGQSLKAKIDADYLWNGRKVWLVDGSHCSMPDTPQLQDTFGQAPGQSKGCGFPVAKLVCLFCWASGAIIDIAIGAYRSSELTLWRQLWGNLNSGDIILADRYYCAYADILQLLEKGCDCVFRLQGARTCNMNFRKGKRLGRDDRLVTWHKSKQCPRSLSLDMFDLLPETLTVRILRFHTKIPGFRSKTIMVATTLLDPKIYSLEMIAQLYADRWTIELRLRDIKATLGMDVLRCKSSDVVCKEIYMHLMAYNLIRALMWQASLEHNRPLHRLSFAGTVQSFDVAAPYLYLFCGTSKAVMVYKLLLKWIADDILPYRPNRIEPRAVKRRPKGYDLINRPRRQMRQELLK